MDKEGVPKKNAPYYVKWVSDCYRFVDKPETQSLTNEQTAEFLSRLTKKHEDWQVQQADRALRLYGYFLTRKQISEGEPSVDNQGDWKEIEEKMRQALRLRHRSYSTEKTYILWLRQFQGFFDGKHHNSLDGKDLQNFLSYLAVERKVSASTQNQALNAIVFLYRHVFDKNIEGEINAVRAKQKRRLPVVLSVKEVDRIVSGMSGINRLMAP
ncbi:MAG: site-specific integrase [Thermodesulfovibrionales bacterium]|nr:site-specific integrase [Thermodesulfovibrionales bacterium]